MKKTVITIILSAFLIMGFFVADYYINNSFVMVKTESVAKKQVKRYVNATGICREQNKREIRVDLPFTVEKVFVNVGDKINQGQKILEVNKDGLKSKLELQTVTASSVSNDNLIAKINNFNSDILSPINGIVTKLYVDEGSQINTTLPVMVVSDLDNLIIKASVPEGIINDIFVGQRVLISGDSVTGEIEGEVQKIYPAGERNELMSAQSIITVDVSAETYENIRPESTLNIAFEKKAERDSIVIPFDSVNFDEDEPYVYINNLGYAAKRVVELGEEYDTEVEILSGIYEGDKLVINPKYEKICEGDKLLTVGEE